MPGAGRHAAESVPLFFKFQSIVLVWQIHTYIFLFFYIGWLEKKELEKEKRSVTAYRYKKQKKPIQFEDKIQFLVL